jgi:hypothetical protein
MIKHCKLALVAAGMTLVCATVQAETAADRTLTFAIPSHALHSYVATLDERSDFSVFVDKDCPTDLQRLALRKLWRMMPQDVAESAFN